MSITGDVMIGRERVEDADRSFRAVNPTTGKLLEPAFAFAGAAEVERACALAWAAFPVYGETALEDRARFLEIIAASQTITARGPPPPQRAPRSRGCVRCQ
jgi:2,5-dioxopentanoate dehydrogenase